MFTKHFSAVTFKLQLTNLNSKRTLNLESMSGRKHKNREHYTFLCNKNIKEEIFGFFVFFTVVKNTFTKQILHFYIFRKTNK